MIPSTQQAQIAELFRRLGEIERRSRNRKRTGVVREVDHRRGLARVELSAQDGTPFLSPWMAWKEIAAGAIRSHIPPAAGEQVDVVSESGDLTDAVIDMSTPSNANPRPHDGPEAVLTLGATRILVGDGRVEIRADVTVGGRLTVEGPELSHNGRNVGSDHSHVDVEPGPGQSGPPA